MFLLFLLGLIAAAPGQSPPAGGPYKDSWCSMVPAPRGDYRPVEGVQIRPVPLDHIGPASDLLATRSAVRLSANAAARFGAEPGRRGRVYLVRGAVYALNSDDLHNRLDQVRIEAEWASATRTLVVSLYQPVERGPVNAMKVPFLVRIDKVVGRSVLLCMLYH